MLEAQLVKAKFEKEQKVPFCLQQQKYVYKKEKKIFWRAQSCIYFFNFQTK